MIFHLSLDKLSKGITIFTILLMAFAAVSPFFFSPEDVTPAIFLIPFFIIILILPYLWKPRYYEITEDSLIIHRIIRPVRISLSDIETVRAGDKEEFRNSIRLFGSGGFFGYYGKFRNNTHKTFTMHASRMSNYVLIFTKKGLKVLTPDKQQEMVEALQQRLSK